MSIEKGLVKAAAGKKGTFKESSMPPKSFRCKQCGHCCLNLLEAYYTSIPQDDIDLWKKKGRDDILSWVVVVSTGGSPVYDIWVSPSTGEHVNRCPWLRKLPNKDKYICRIQDVKPKHCGQFPTSKKHAQETGCRGFTKE